MSLKYSKISKNFSNQRQVFSCLERCDVVECLRPSVSNLMGSTRIGLDPVADDAGVHQDDFLDDRFKKLISTRCNFVARMRKGTPASQSRIRARLDKSCDLIGQRIQRTKSSDDAAAIRKFPLRMCRRALL